MESMFNRLKKKTKSLLHRVGGALFEKPMQKLIAQEKAQTKTMEQLLTYIKVNMNKGHFDHYNYSPAAYLNFKAMRESAELVEKNMESALVFDTRDSTQRLNVLDHALSQTMIDGFALEFGVFRGKSINIIAGFLPEKQIYGFDSFEGLPEDWNGYFWEKGHFAVDHLPQVPDNVTLVKGWFSDTLPVFVKESKIDAISFLHVDSDLYSSAKTIFDSLKEFIKVGTIIVFDEYYNYVNWKNGEYKAFMEFCESERVQFTYLAFGHYQVSVRIISIGGESA